MKNGKKSTITSENVFIWNRYADHIPKRIGFDRVETGMKSARARKKHWESKYIALLLNQFNRNVRDRHQLENIYTLNVRWKIATAIAIATADLPDA